MSQVPGSWILAFFLVMAVYWIGLFVLLVRAAICIMRRGWRCGRGIAFLGFIALHVTATVGSLEAISGANALRRAEVAGFARIPVPEVVPRDVVIVANTGMSDVEADAFDLAESGRFDVWLTDPEPGPVHRIAVADPIACAQKRADAALAGKAGPKAVPCAEITEVAATPASALVLYVGDAAAPLSPNASSIPRLTHTILVDWVLQLSLRQDGVERLIAYDEFLREKRYAYHPFLGLVVEWAAPPMRREIPLVSIPGRPGPSLGAFLTASLELYRHEPPATPGARDARLAPILAALLAAQSRDADRTIAEIATAHPVRDDGIAEALTTMLKQRPQPLAGSAKRTDVVDCLAPITLERHRDALSEGCRLSAKNWGNCGSQSTDYWYEMCLDHRRVWETPDPQRLRVAVLRPFPTNWTDVALTNDPTHDLGSIEIAVPGDRGLVDLFLHGSEIWTLSGAVECIGEVTLLGRRTGVAGLPRRKVRLAGNFFNNGLSLHGYFGAQSPSDLLTDGEKLFLGEARDATLVDLRASSIDLGTVLPKARPGHACATAPLAPPPSRDAEGRIHVDLDSLVVPPGTVAIQRVRPPT